MTAHGFGKVLLFGEHFVVYGCPAVGAALDRVTTIQVSKSASGELEIDFPLTREQLRQSAEAAGIIADALGLEDRNYRFSVQSSIPVGEHLGSSAAFCVAVTRAIAQVQGKKLDQEYISAVAIRGEKVFHAKPSGIDTVLAAYGGCVSFERGSTPQAEKLKSRNPLTLVVASDGRSVPTRQMVDQVYQLKLADPGGWDRVIARAETLVKQAKQALLDGDASVIGQFMDINHGLLQSIGVSTPLLDEMVVKARENGAYGAKLTGGGGGGCMIALCPDTEAQRVVEALTPLSSFTFITSTGM